MSAAQVVATIRAQRVVAVVRSASAAEALATGRRLVAAGLRAVEVSLTTPEAGRAVAALAAEAPDGVMIGAGTVLDEAAARAAIEAGARFLVSPIVSPGMLVAAQRAGVATLPGAATPTEMLSAYRLGADLVKVFPASLWTPAAVSHLLDALPQLPLVPTGGVAVGTAPEWLAAGAVAVGIGGALARAGAEELAALLARLAAVPR